MSGLVLLNTVVLVLFLYLLPSSNLRSVSLTFIVCCNRCCDRGKIAKLSAKRNKLTSVLVSAGISFFVVVTNADVNNL